MMENPDQTMKREIMQGENQSLPESVFAGGKKGTSQFYFQGSNSAFSVTY